MDYDIKAYSNLVIGSEEEQTAYQQINAMYISVSKPRWEKAQRKGRKLVELILAAEDSEDFKW